MNDIKKNVLSLSIILAGRPDAKQWKKSEEEGTIIFSNTGICERISILDFRAVPVEDCGLPLIIMDWLCFSGGDPDYEGDPTIIAEFDPDDKDLFAKMREMLDEIGPIRHKSIKKRLLTKAKKKELAKRYGD